MEIAKIPKKYNCISCDYHTSNKKDFEKHNFTLKHINGHQKSQSPRLCEEVASKQVYTCTCGKQFVTNSGLWKHTKKCVPVTAADQANTPPKSDTAGLSSELIVELVKQNQEFKQLLVEQNAKLIELSSKPTYVNSNNNNKTKFNLNFFLNEQCKDALNITDFVNSLKLTLTDLENTGKHGFVNGISEIFIRGLKELDVYKRPIHCSDLKRETIYVKDQNVWEKENEEKIKLYKSIQQIASRNINQIPLWMVEHPQYSDYYSKQNDEYLKIVNESMGAGDDEENSRYYNKIVKNVSKEVVIDSA
jgi:hypothetical protein